MPVSTGQPVVKEANIWFSHFFTLDARALFDCLSLDRFCSIAVGTFSRLFITSAHSDPVDDQKTGKPVTGKPVLGASKPAARASKLAAKMAGDHGNITIINNAAAWDAKIEEAKNTSKIVVVDFTATWCGPCRLMSPIFTELSKKFESLTFLKVDVDEVQDVTAKWEVRAMPTFIFIKDGKLLDKIVGANKEDLERKCNHYATTTVTSSA